jgi:hypothetical protein
VRLPASLLFAGRIATAGDRASSTSSHWAPFAKGLLGAICAAELPMFSINRLAACQR